MHNVEITFKEPEIFRFTPKQLNISKFENPYQSLVVSEGFESINYKKIKDAFYNETTLKVELEKDGQIIRFWEFWEVNEISQLSPFTYIAYLRNYKYKEKSICEI